MLTFIVAHWQALYAICVGVAFGFMCQQMEPDDGRELFVAFFCAAIWPVMVLFIIGWFIGAIGKLGKES